MELTIQINEEELELLPYVAAAFKMVINPDNDPQENARIIANAIKANLIEDAVKKRVEHAAQQAAAQEADRLKEHIQPKSFGGGFY
ncbi:hypothetical protein EKK58_09520 [Candidatus Dependentiae bacterium]|nr:MAG: hypothetical protein EKK58_09520 [Candidatus Dependentiae bacterium]